LVESDGGYKKRIWENVMIADATIRLAVDFNSRGEICTANAIKKYEKPTMDIPLNRFHDPTVMVEVYNWLKENGIDCLNVAGNTERMGKIYPRAFHILFIVFAMANPAILEVI